MARSANVRTSTLLIAVPLLALVGLALAHWVAPAEAQLGGHAQVSRLELRYAFGEGAVDARFHLASGLAVDQRVDDITEIDLLLQAAQVLAGGKARMSASVASNQVTAWYLSVP